MAIKPVQRHQYREIVDGKKLFVCRAKHNPVFFKNESGIYAPISLTDYKSEILSTVNPISDNNISVYLDKTLPPSSKILID